MRGRGESAAEARPEGGEQRRRTRTNNGEEDAPGSGVGQSGTLGTDASTAVGSERQLAKTPRAQGRSWYSRKKKKHRGSPSPLPPRTGAEAKSSVSPVKETEEPMIMD